MAVRITNSSRLRFGEAGTLDGVEFFDLIDIPEIPPQTDDIEYVVVGTDRIDELAQQFYEDAGFWWVIAVANELEILPTELHVGDTLRIPSPRFVRQSLFTKQRR